MSERERKKDRRERERERGIKIGEREKSEREKDRRVRENGRSEREEDRRRERCCAFRGLGPYAVGMKMRSLESSGLSLCRRAFVAPVPFHGHAVQLTAD